MSDSVAPELSMREYGTLRAQYYENIWDDSERMSEETRDAFRHRAKQYADEAVKTDPAIKRWTLSIHVRGYVLLACIIVPPFLMQDDNFAWTFVVGILGGVVMFFVWISGFAGRSSAAQKLRDQVTASGVDEAIEAFSAAIVSRRFEAQNHVPGQPSDRGPAPLPQPFGVSHQGAEELVAQWMRHLGQPDAITTKYAGDGGVDVASVHYIAQVKNYRGSVDIESIRALAGVAAVEGRRPLFFTSGQFSAGAVDFCESLGYGALRVRR